MAQSMNTAAPKGERMIEIRVRFWTNDIAEVDGDVIPGHAWSSGVVRTEANRTHGIKPGDAVPFNSLLDLLSAIEKTLIQHGVTLHPSRRMGKYVVAKPAQH